MLKTNFYDQSKSNISLRTNYADLKAIFEDYNKITHNIKMKIVTPYFYLSDKSHSYNK